MKTGVYGGTFDPVHVGHLALARAARSAHGLDRVLFVPCGDPPHKRAPMASAEDRFRMVELAVGEAPGLVADRLELDRAGTSYTVDTLRALRERWPDDDLYFLIGGDSVGELPSWRSLPEIFRLARLVAVNRPGYGDGGELLERIRAAGVDPERVARFAADRVAMAPVDVSSSDIRASLARGEAVDGALPGSVARYIRDRGLYRTNGFSACDEST